MRHDETATPAMNQPRGIISRRSRQLSLETVASSDVEGSCVIQFKKRDSPKFAVIGTLRLFLGTLRKGLAGRLSLQWQVMFDNVWFRERDNVASVKAAICQLGNQLSGDVPG